ncbi:hypothetical protein [Rhizobium rosettiformans]|uniref:hypothetical protein n=1 Tax=Rhizobium rosettiformans TaxID=1368430 RepID=UPI0017AF2595|nr:hypothetical protein [Rhizobium rosettiformans]MBA4798867.1 hypothetical protein [Hyphomicrobiales bacterium]MDR7026806.1 hypothetical protein [Rhizobium rosettiformans]MDR7064927.1 hypothetical protein [Rhizobium rosettiformans]
MTEKRIAIANLAQSEIKGRNFVTFDVAMNGHVIATVDAPLMSGRILWTHAAFHGFSDFNPGEKVLLEAEVDRALSPPATVGQTSSWRHH